MHENASYKIRLIDPEAKTTKPRLKRGFVLKIRLKTTTLIAIMNTYYLLNLSMNSNKFQIIRRAFSLENLPTVLLSILLVLVVTVFSYSQVLSFVYLKALTVSLGALVVFIVAVLGMIKRGSITYPKSPVFLSLVGVLLVFLLSSIFSTSRMGSFLGYGFETVTSVFMLVMVLLTYLVSVSFSTIKKMLAVNAAFFIVAGLLGIFYVSRIFLGANFLSLGIFGSVLSNTIGKFNEIGIFFGASLLISLFALEILKLNKIQKVLTYIVGILSLFILIVVNFSTIWYVLGIIALIFFVYTAAHSTVLAERMTPVGSPAETGETRPEMPRRKLAIKTLVVAVVALLFVLPVGQDIASSINTKFEINNIEARPSWSATAGIIRDSFKKDPLLGVGPNRYAIAWQLYRPDINLTNFWATNFDSGIGYLPTTVTETGILGGVAWLAFVLALFWLGLRSMFSRYTDRRVRYFVLSTLSVTIFLWTMNIFYVPGIVMTFLSFFFVGLFLASATLANVSTNRTFLFLQYPRLGFIVTMFGVITLVASAGLGYVMFEQGRASVFFEKALAAAQNNDISGAENGLLDAIRLSKRDVYYRSLAQLNLARVNNLITAASGKSGPTQEQKVEFQSDLANAVQAARLAQVADPFKYDNQTIVAQVYGTVVSVGVEGSYEAAKAAYEEAIKVSPRNPGLYLSLAQLAVVHKDAKSAQSFLDQSLQLKPNYIDAIFFQAQLDAAQGNLASAVKHVEQIAVLTPTDPLIFFRLGLLKYDAKDYQGAIGAFEKSISLVPVYANAKYFLGLSYAAAGRQADAINLFTELKADNPTNTELDAILTNLKAGRTPFASAPVENTKPEKRKTLPVAEPK